METALLIGIFHYSHDFFARGVSGLCFLKIFIKMSISINQRNNFQNLLILKIGWKETSRSFLCANKGWDEQCLELEPRTGWRTAGWFSLMHNFLLSLEIKELSQRLKKNTYIREEQQLMQIICQVVLYRIEGIQKCSFYRSFDRPTILIHVCVS